MRIGFQSESLFRSLLLKGAALFVVFLVFFLSFCVVHEAQATTSPFGVALPDTTGPIATEGVWGQIQGYVIARQSEFYLALKDAVKLVKTSHTALLLLLGLSFGYGLFHAVGPGHGKVILTTYLFASGASARKGAVMALLGAAVQASVAVLLIGIAAVILNMTAMVITQTAQLLELASYSLFVILGIWLLMRAWRAFKLAWASRSHTHEESCPLHSDHEDSHKHLDHGHAHDHAHSHAHSHDLQGECSCGHSHSPTLEVIESANGFRGMALAIFSMGLRPCSGALIVLVFALSQKVFWAGVLASYAMGLGTGLTVALLALMAVYARSFSQMIVDRGFSNRVLDWFGASVLFVAGLVVFAFGGVLLLANLL
ncbi:hypothetical protein [uncultured Cohaesibacter sp.]|uniref:nickel/cobalt transporter n=1 Tax=uncultured Cohaesibacter sp. TaxID=1002546 RepID=UPI0029316EE0|nr:hypothetical protein [uncultured Cohaesibacter sp.]